jgi:hypothetical protein
MEIMVSGNCPNCGKHYNNLGAHRCKNMAMKPVDKPTLLNEPTPTQTEPTPIIKKSFWDRFKRSHKLHEGIPKKLFSTDAIKDSRITSLQLTDEQKFQRFFGNLPKWATKKPGFFQLRRLGKNFRHCVLVSDDPKEKDVECFIPYNKELGVLQTDTGYWDMPVKEKGTIYLHAKKFRPLVNGDDYSKEFDIPEDFATSLITRGIDFAQLAQFSAVLKQISSLKMFLWLFGIVTAIVIIGAVLIIHGYNTSLSTISVHMGNMSEQLKRINP